MTNAGSSHSVSRTQFLNAYEAMLRMYAPNLCWPSDYLDNVRDSIDGKPPYYELRGSNIAQHTWNNLGNEGEVTTAKVSALPA